jgi:glucose/arabinose dehydrogenase
MTQLFRQFMCKFYLYSHKWLFFCALLSLPMILAAQPKIQLQQFATGFTKPLDIAHCGDSRLFIVEQRGVISIVDSLGVKQTVPFLDIDPRVNSGGNEQGLLGLAFHPNYKTNGYFYVNYIRSNGDTRISRFSTMPGDSTAADPNSEAIMIDIPQPFSNHNGGCMKFGPDGYLYFTQGDGGSGGDPNGNGQKKTTMLGKMLRIDVNLDTLPYYKIPTDNPFVTDPAYLPEIWSVGLRNAWRFSFDRLTGDIWIGDVGQNIQEEIDFEPANTGGRNYGWRCYEAALTYNTSGCLPASNYVFPIFDYPHSAANGCSITGGFIYRGTKYSDLYGKYIFPDYCSGRWWVITPDGNGDFNTAILANLSAYEYSALGEDSKGELYACAHASGKIFKIKELCSGFKMEAASTDATCESLSNGSVALNITGAAAPYNITWNNGGDVPVMNNLAPGQYIVAVQDANQCVRRDTLTVGEISPVLGTPVINFATNITVLCNGMPIDIIASSPAAPGFTYTWYKDGSIIQGSTDTLLTVTEPGIYGVSWINSTTGCQSALGQTAPIEFQTIVLFDLSYTNGVIKADATISGQWYFDGVAIPGAIGWTYTPLESGYYSLVVTSPNGCTGAAGIDVLVSGTVLPPSVQQFLVTPNPASNFLQVTALLASRQKVTMLLTDALGKTVREKVIDSDLLQCTFDLMGLPAGDYLCCLQLKEGTVVKKVVKL